LSSSSHFPLVPYSIEVKPVALPARSRQTFDEAGADGIDGIYEYDRHSALLQRRQRPAAADRDDVRRKRDQFHRVSELRAPASVKGTFIPVGHSFDAFAALAKVLQGATRDVLIVDPFMDETVLSEFGGTVSSGVTLRLLADQASQKQSYSLRLRRRAKRLTGLNT
jgi:hypothetical protein